MATITCLPSSSLKPNQLSYYDPVTLINIVTGFFMSDFNDKQRQSGRSSEITGELWPLEK